MEFTQLRDLLAKNFEENVGSNLLYEVDVDKDEMWNLYLDSFPAGTNPIYRVRREYDCSCCRNFIRNIGGTVYIDDDLNVHSIFDFYTNDDAFQPVFDALNRYVTSKPIIGKYITNERIIGTDSTHEMEDDHSITTYHHFFLRLPNHLVCNGRTTLDTQKGQFRATRNVFKRSLDEITLDAIDTVLELIYSNTLYKGQEWQKALEDLRAHKTAYDALEDRKKEIYCWKMAQTVGNVVGRIRNHSIGVLLTDISNGDDLDGAVRRYEAIVAPTNYKRPKAIFTKKMLEDAQRKFEEMGYMDSLPRRFARLDDITVNNILFSNRDAGKRIGGTVFDDMLSDAKQSPKQFSRVEEISAEKFVKDVLPTAKEVYAFVESRHAPNMVSLIAPVNPDAKTMFKWNNGFSWAYQGNMTDSDIRENVKNAGGKVDGVLRFSIQWNDIDGRDNNDLDAHCIEVCQYGRHIYFMNKVSNATGGNLDVDIMEPKGRVAVENITFPEKRRMRSGDYNFYVHCFANRGGTSGFRAEIEFDGQIYHYDYSKPLRQGEGVTVAIVTLDNAGRFSIEHALPPQTVSREIWGVKTNQFVPVSVILYSPNYWDEQNGIGHKHYMFMLKGCVNPEHPNGFYNEFLRNELDEHRRVLEALGSKMAVESTEDQLSGLGFSATKRNDLIVKVIGSVERVIKIIF